MIDKGTLLEGKYEIIEQIGSGGGGTVYLAYHYGLQKHLVVKEIKGAYHGQANIRLEVDILKYLQHPSLPQVYDFVLVYNQVYTVMQYIDGYDLEYYRKNGYRIPEWQLIEWLKKLLDALDYLHTREITIIHSDIKPANIMVDSCGRAYLIDFNISIDTVETIVKGASLDYAAPEQVKALYQCMEGAPAESVLGQKTDLYSLGLTFYAIMTGQVPNRNRNQMYPIESFETGYSEALIGVINKLMELNPSRRYESAKKALHALTWMEKRPSEKLRRWNIGISLAYVGALMVSICMCVIGIFDNWNISYKEDYESMQWAYYAYELEEVREIGTAILEENLYKNSLKNNSAQESEIYYMLGETYYWEENYVTALSYYEDAISIGNQVESDVSVYYRDAIICMAKKGDYDAALLLLQEGQSQGIFNEDLLLAQAELLLYQGEIEEAKAIFEQMISESQDEEIIYRSCIEMANIYEDEGQWKSVSTYLEGADAINHNILLLRKLGVAYSNTSIYSDDMEEKADGIESAKEVYEELMAQPEPTYEDYLNFATVYEVNGEYLKSVTMLQKLEEKYPDDYVISKRLCYALYYIEVQKSIENRDYTGVIYYYQKALQGYVIIRNSGVEDIEMTQLEQIVSSLGS